MVIYQIMFCLFLKGLSDFLFSDQPSCYIISNGAECLQISKKFYLDNASQDVLDKLRQQVCNHSYSDTAKQNGTIKMPSGQSTVRANRLGKS